MRIFSFSELHGPFTCESQQCKQISYDCFLTDEENKTLPKQSGPTAAKYILENGIGIMLCENCLKKRIKKMITKTEEWKEFSERVTGHIENYVIPQYGDYPDEMIENWDVKSIQDQLVRYVKRIDTNVRSITEGRRDALKIAHYACYLFDKLMK